MNVPNHPVTPTVIPPHDHTADGAPGAPDVVMRSPSDFVPNDWNPNRMPEEGFQALMEEVKRAGTTPKPIAARLIADGKLEIIDGEHNWRAAVEAGLETIPCVILEVDDFEAMTQTYKRNQSGTHCPLRDGLMFQRMLARDPSMSNRELANQSRINEKTIRNKLKYVEALAMRKGSAVEELDLKFDADDDDCQRVAEMSLKQLEAYVDLPKAVRDRWLDAGASLSMLHYLVCPSQGEGFTGRQLLKELAMLELGDLVDFGAKSVASLERLSKFVSWKLDCAFIEEIEAYIRPAAELKLPAAILDALPYTPAEEEGFFRCLIAPDTWTEILQSAVSQSNDAEYRRKLIGDGVTAALKEAGYDPAAALSQKQLGMYADLQNAPDFIKNAECLSLEEKHRLDNGGYGNESVKQAVVDEFTRRRRDNAEPQLEGSSVMQVYRNAAAHADQTERANLEEATFDDPEQMVTAIADKYSLEQALTYGMIQGRPAREVLLEELRKVSPQILAMIASAVRFPLSATKPIDRWFMAAGGTYRTEPSD